MLAASMPTQLFWIVLSSAGPVEASISMPSSAKLWMMKPRIVLSEVRSQGWPYYKTTLSRSPKIEALNSGGRRPLSILHHGRASAVYGQMHELASEVLLDLGLATTAPVSIAAAVAAGAASPEARPRRPDPARPASCAGRWHGRRGS